MCSHPRFASLLLLLLLTMAAALPQRDHDDQNTPSDRLSEQHSLELAIMRRDMDNLREELKSCTSCNEKRNSQLTLEWAMDTVSELRREMREMEAANNASGWQQELRNEVATILAEAEGVTKLAAADGARLAAGEARQAELMLDMRQVRDIATTAKATCDSMKDDIAKMRADMKTQFKLINKKMYVQNREEFPVMNTDIIEDSKHGYHKIRHLHSLRKQVDELRHAHHNFYLAQTQMKSQLKELQRNVQSVLETRNLQDDFKLQQLIDDHDKHSQAIQNVTMEVSNFNKLHASMLELLESMETLENKVDKTVPDFRKEISKLDVDVAQIRSHNSYLKEDQENIRQSMKAVAVSVSNLVDKVNVDHSTLGSLNSTVKNIQKEFEWFKDSDKALEMTLKEVQNIDGSSATANEISMYKKSKQRMEKISGSLPKSCKEVDGITNSFISLGDGVPILTKCIDSWTLIQTRWNGSLDFNRKYNEYADGFGSPTGEFWIGNEVLHRLTSDNCSSLRVKMFDVSGKNWHAEYEYFNVGPKSSGYRLNIGGYSGNASDALEYQNGMEFSAIDRDRDISKIDCAADYEGGWWFSRCQRANLNGRYELGLTWFNAAQNEWIALASSEMSVRKRDKCEGMR